MHINIGFLLQRSFAHRKIKMPEHTVDDIMSLIFVVVISTYLKIKGVFVTFKLTVKGLN